MGRPQLPKHLREPVGGVSLADEPTDVKAARMLKGLRHFAAGKKRTMAFTLDGVQMMLIRFEPQPFGRDNPDADLAGGQEL